MSSFPQPWRSTVSHWQATNRGKGTLWEHNKTARLPQDEVDIVIIGGGMSGVSLAYALTRKDMPSKRIVLVEAKDVASGASGRNGGHVAPYSFKEWSRLQDSLESGGAGLDAEEAFKVVKLENDNLSYVTETVRQNGWKCDLWRGEKLIIATTPEESMARAKAYKAWLKARGTRHDVPQWEWIDDPEETRKLSRLIDPLGIAKGPAGSIHPHKLATNFLKASIDSGRCEYFSWCPVTSFTPTPDDGGGWTVDCGPRGILRTKEVVVCTNAHTSHLFKGQDIDKHLTPFQLHAAQITPTAAYSGLNALEYTYNIENGPYLIQTPDGHMIFGPETEATMHLTPGGRKDIFGVVDDSFVREEYKIWLSQWCQKSFVDWGEQALGEGAQRFWTGIVCATRDTLPLVGEVPNQKGLWICVGFQGHGMGRIPQTTRLLANTIAQSQWDAYLPESFRITTERMENPQKSPPYTDARRKGMHASGDLP